MNQTEPVAGRVTAMQFRYPPGTRAERLSLEDPYAPMPPGTRGTVEMVGGAGQELLSRLGASMTDYGAPSARGQPLFRLLTPEDAVLTEESTPTWGEMQL